MALIAIAADKGSPGVTTTSVALAAIWPRPVLLAECDPSGGDLVYRLPAADGGPLDPRRGLLNLAVAARRGLEPHQVWQHTQRLHGGLDVLTGVSGAEQGAGLELLWGAVGQVLARIPQADVMADCGRLGVDGPIYDLLAAAASVVLLTRATVGEVIRLRDRVAALALALGTRGRPAAPINVVVVTDYKSIASAVEQVGQALRQTGAPARVIGGLADEPKSAEQLRGAWGGKLDKSMFIRSARAIAADLVAGLPGLASLNGPPAQPSAPSQAPPQPAAPQPGPSPGAGPPQPFYLPPPGGAAPAAQPQYHGPAPASDPRPAPSGPPYQAGPPPYQAGPPWVPAGPPAGPPPGTQYPAGPPSGPQYAVDPPTAPGPQHPLAGWSPPRTAPPWSPPPGPPAAGQAPAQPGQGYGGLPHRSGRGRHAGRRGEHPAPPPQADEEPEVPPQPEPTSSPSLRNPGGR
jgi:cellulose biosynthesis protein BcsQ